MSFLLLHELQALDQKGTRLETLRQDASKQSRVRRPSIASLVNIHAARDWLAAMRTINNCRHAVLSLSCFLAVKAGHGSSQRIALCRRAGHCSAGA